MFLLKKKRKVFGVFKDEKGISYKLANESQKETDSFILYRGNEAIPPWEVHKIKIDLVNSEIESVNLFVNKYLRTSSNLKSCLQKIKFPFNALNEIVNSSFKGNTFIKETILEYQDVLDMYEFIESLPHEEQWLVLTQNTQRTKQNMKAYQQMYMEVVSSFLQQYLSKPNIEKNERVYGEWKSLMYDTFEKFYSYEDLIRAVHIGKSKTDLEIEGYESQLKEIQEKIAELDVEFEESTISQKFKMEELVKTELGKEVDKKIEIEDAREKLNRIESYFINELRTFHTLE